MRRQILRLRQIVPGLAVGLSGCRVAGCLAVEPSVSVSVAEYNVTVWVDRLLMLMLMLPLLLFIYLFVMMLDRHLLAAQYITLCSLACSTPCSTAHLRSFTTSTANSASQKIFSVPLTSQLFAPSLRLRSRWPSPSRPTLVDGSKHTFSRFF